MYNYTQIPNNFNRQMNTANNSFNNQALDNRIIGGGFLGPFVLGGLTGGLVAPFFYGNNGYGRPNYNYNYYYPYPPYYGPYYR